MGTTISKYKKNSPKWGISISKCKNDICTIYCFLNVCMKSEVNQSRDNGIMQKLHVKLTKSSTRGTTCPKCE